mgnify:CR=1 FL=1
MSAVKVILGYMGLITNQDSLRALSRKLAPPLVTRSIVRGSEKYHVPGRLRPQVRRRSEKHREGSEKYRAKNRAGCEAYYS